VIDNSSSFDELAIAISEVSFCADVANLPKQVWLLIFYQAVKTKQLDSLYNPAIDYKHFA